MEVVAVLLHQLLRGGEALGSTGGYIGCHSADRFEYHRIGIAILLAPRILIAKMAMMANFSAYIPNALTGKINLWSGTRFLSSQTFQEWVFEAVPLSATNPLRTRTHPICLETKVVHDRPVRTSQNGVKAIV
jgi:hypothetical protein